MNNKKMNIFIKVFNLLWKESKLFIIFMILYTIISGILPSISLVAMQELINSLQMPLVNLQRIIKYIVIYLITDLVIMVLDICKKYFETQFNLKSSMNFNILFLKKISKFEYYMFEDSEIYNKIQKGKGQFGKIYEYFQNIMSIYKYVITIISSLFIIINWRKWTIVVIIVVSIINSIILYKLGKEQYKIYEKRIGKEREREYYKYILSNDITMKEINAYSIQNYFINQYKVISEKFIREDKKILLKSSKIQTVISLIDQLIMGTFLGIIVHDTFLDIIQIGNTVSYIRCLSNIKNTTSNLFGSIVGLFQNSLYLEDFFSIIELDNKNLDENKEIFIDSIEKIEVKNLSFKYQKNKTYSIRNINFLIEKGDTIIIVGKNGSGKTTLFKLLLGYYPNYEGEILINDIDLKKINKESLRKNISVLFQDFNRYEMTLKSNISLGNSICDEDINYMLEKFWNKDKKISLSQQLGNWFKGGKQLSGGEWSKVGICRALVRNSDLVLLDEPNAFLDSNTESILFNELNNRNKIQIIISHRYEKITKNCNSILVLDNGEIKGYGSHEKLINSLEIYRELYNTTLSSK